jgi:hypothetical protein
LKVTCSLKVVDTFMPEGIDSTAGPDPDPPTVTETGWPALSCARGTGASSPAK